MKRILRKNFLLLRRKESLVFYIRQNDKTHLNNWRPTQLAFYVNLHRAVIGPSATLTGRWRPDIDLRRMLTGYKLIKHRLEIIGLCLSKSSEKMSYVTLSTQINQDI